MLLVSSALVLPEPVAVWLTSLTVDTARYVIAAGLGFLVFCAGAASASGIG